MTKLIALLGKKGSGKTEVSKMIMKGNVGKTIDVLKFANPLKNMTRTFLSALGMYADEIEEAIEGKTKETVIEALGVSSRHIMQTLGTEWGRNCISKDVWLDIVRTRVKQSKADLILIDDCRFLNEAELIRELGGKLIRVHRLDQDSSDEHPSEKEMGFVSVDATIYNDGSLEDLKVKVKDCFDEDRSNNTR